MTTERPTVDVEVRHETPEGIETDVIENATNTWTHEGLHKIERKNADGYVEWQEGYNQDRVLSMRREWDTEEIERPEADETFRNIGRALLLAIGFAFGSLTTYAVTHSGGQVGF